MLHPVKALEQIIEEYKDFILTEFRAKDSQLKESLERELVKTGFLAQEPFYQVHRPFKEVKKWQDLPIEKKLGKILEQRSRSEYCYLHQSEAIEHLLSNNATSIVVTTGTGSGKTECFLLPVIQNAIYDVTSFKKPGLTAILLYPMNALANDQLERIKDYLEATGYSGSVKVAKYDRGTTQSQRDELRKEPPHILLTNYMMLEYLLVRPADREDIFANHRCRFLVLDEVHTYRGALGTNIAFLVRRLEAHLKRARQDWNTNPEENFEKRRYPDLIPIGTSATIKSENEDNINRDEFIRKRDDEIQDFFAKLTGYHKGAIKVLGEELQEITIPKEAKYSDSFSEINDIDISDKESIRKAICKLAGIAETNDINTAIKRCKILWDLNSWLIKRPMSISQIVDKIFKEIPARSNYLPENIQKEIETALLIGGVLPEGNGLLRLKAHQFIRGGWEFYRCVNPDCGKLYPKGEEKCECGHITAPLYLCRNCGADYLRLVGTDEAEELRPSNNKLEGQEWMVYQPDKFGELHDEEDTAENIELSLTEKISKRIVQSMKGKEILYGSLNINNLNFSSNENGYPLKVILAPGRNRCLCCGMTAGSRNVVSHVSLGTSAAIKVLSEGTIEALEEAHKDNQESDKKERLLIFSDSRQDAAHQARFIRFASRYDRMRRRVVYLLTKEGPLTIQRAVELLSDLGRENKDNPYLPEGTIEWISDDVRQRTQSYEEAPLLDEIAVNAGFRATVLNLGLVGVSYNRLDEYIKSQGKDIVKKLGLNEEQFNYLCKCILDKIRILACVNRNILKYHPSNLRYPCNFNAAEWERSVKHPKGFPVNSNGEAIGYLDQDKLPYGIKVHNPWRKPDSGGRGPATERLFEHLVNQMGGSKPEEELLLEILEFLKAGSFLVVSDLFGYRDSAKLLQINSESLILKMLDEETRFKCSVCGLVISDAKKGFSCPYCHGKLMVFKDEEVNKSRYVKRIKTATLAILEAAEHTAQVSNDVRIDIEDKFKSAYDESKLNILACSPTLEMGIDVGGLDAILMRNIPPRPDNYAQRGGRAGRRQRVGLVLGYIRNTPHDQYFYEHPEEMIAGEVVVPQLALGNRDILIRHLNSIIFGASEPGLAGRMVEYVDAMGNIKQDKVDELINGIKIKIDYALELSKIAWGSNILNNAGLTEQNLKDILQKLPEKIQDIFNRTSRQVKELRAALETYYTQLRDPHAGHRAGELVARILGIQTTGRRNRQQADDWSSGYPLRRFAEFGILPGYEFPDQPASLRLLGDTHEEDLISVNRRFGIAQYQPDAQVYARTQRWRVIGLDTSSPWNPYGSGQKWPYRLCSECGLRYDGHSPRCPRCTNDAPSKAINAIEYAGFLARKDEAPILDEEERYAIRSNVLGYPQWDGEVIGRWTVGEGWGLRLSRRESVMWLNEGNKPTERERKKGIPLIHSEAKGFILCPVCGHILSPQLPENNNKKGRRKTRKSNDADSFRHSPKCAKKGQPENPIAFFTKSQIEILRLLVPIPERIPEESLKEWGLSLGYSLRSGARHRYALDAAELEFILEGPWKTRINDITYNQVSLTFIDPHVGGSGYLPRIAQEFDKISKDAVNYLNHKDCDTACYRCLKSYQNQRFHEYLKWPRIISDIESLAITIPAERPLEKGDIDDPTPWLEAYKAGVGSPLELKFLKLFEQNGLNVTKQEPVEPKDGDRPISIADFAIREKRIAIYIDSATFHVGQNLRRDKYIRDRLRNSPQPWKIIELRVSDLTKGKDLVDKVKSI